MCKRLSDFFNRKSHFMENAVYEQLQKVKERVQRFREILGTPLNPVSSLREMVPSHEIYERRVPCTRRSKSSTPWKKRRCHRLRVKSRKDYVWESEGDYSDSSSDDSDLLPCRKSHQLKQLLAKRTIPKKDSHRKPPLFFPKRYAFEESIDETPHKKRHARKAHDSSDSDDICAKVLRSKGPINWKAIAGKKPESKKRKPALPWAYESFSDSSSSYDYSDSSSEDFHVHKKGGDMKRLVKKYAYRVPSSSSASSSETESYSDSFDEYDSSESTSYELSSESESSSESSSSVSSLSESSSSVSSLSESSSSVSSLSESSSSCHEVKKSKAKRSAKVDKKKEKGASTSSSLSENSTSSEVSLASSSVSSSSVHEQEKRKHKRRCPKCHCVLPSSSSSAWPPSTSSSEHSHSRPEPSFDDEAEENIKDLQERARQLFNGSASGEEEDLFSVEEEKGSDAKKSGGLEEETLSEDLEKIHSSESGSQKKVSDEEDLGSFVKDTEEESTHEQQIAVEEEEHGSSSAKPLESEPSSIVAEEELHSPVMTEEEQANSPAFPEEEAAAEEEQANSPVVAEDEQLDFQGFLEEEEAIADEEEQGPVRVEEEDTHDGEAVSSNDD